MEFSKSNSRRQFISTLALGATAGLSALTQPLKAAVPFSSAEVSEAEQWLKSNLKGSHRVVIDGTEPNDAFPLIWTWVYYLGNNQTSVADSDMTALCVLRHNAIPFAMEDRLWEKYNFGEIFNVKDNTTKSPAIRNPYYEPKPGDFPVPTIDGIKRMQERGALFTVCNLAIMVYSGEVAKQLGLDPEEVRKDWVEGLLPGVQVSPSGVWAVTRAQENGCSYVYAGG